MVQWVKNLPALQETPEMWVLPIDQGDPPGEGTGDPLKYSCLENPMDRGDWRATVQRVAKGWTRMTEQLSTDTFE